MAAFLFARSKNSKHAEAPMTFCDWNQVKVEDVSWNYQRKSIEAGPLAVAMLEVLKGATTYPHAHVNEEVVLVLKGAWKFFLPGKEVTLRANQMLWIPAGTEHSSVAMADTLAVDICSSARPDWKTGEDHRLHYDPDQYLWAV
jgi:quercetin dioxygenase-like cupin family protein